MVDATKVKKKRGISRFEDLPYFDTASVTNGKVGHRENVKRVKIPAFCHYSVDGSKTQKLGAINYDEVDNVYLLEDFSGQKRVDEGSVVGKQGKLEDLFKLYDINICKVKIIVFG